MSKPDLVLQLREVHAKATAACDSCCPDDPPWDEIQRALDWLAEAADALQQALARLATAEQNIDLACITCAEYGTVANSKDLRASIKELAEGYIAQRLQQRARLATLDQGREHLSEAMGKIAALARAEVVKEGIEPDAFDAALVAIDALAAPFANSAMPPPPHPPPVPQEGAQDDPK